MGTNGGPTEQASKGVAAEGIRGPPRVQIIPNRPSAEHALTEHTAEVANVPAQQALSEVSTEGAAIPSRPDEQHEALEKANMEQEKAKQELEQAQREMHEARAMAAQAVSSWHEADEREKDAKRQEQ